MTLQITARIERRSWYVDGKYLGNKAEFVADSGETAKELTGDFYGEWVGARHIDGEAILSADHTRYWKPLPCQKAQPGMPFWESNGSAALRFNDQGKHCPWGGVKASAPSLVWASQCAI